MATAEKTETGTITLTLSKEEAEVLNRLLYYHIGGRTREREILTDQIGEALRRVVRRRNPLIVEKVSCERALQLGEE